jgi:hypothetical protein
MRLGDDLAGFLGHRLIFAGAGVANDRRGDEGAERGARGLGPG